MSELHRIGEGPWSGWQVEPFNPDTWVAAVELDDAEAAEVDEFLASLRVDPRIAVLTAQRDQARNLAVALEHRIAEVREYTDRHCSAGIPLGIVALCDLLHLLDSALAVVTE